MTHGGIELLHFVFSSFFLSFFFSFFVLFSVNPYWGSPQRVLALHFSRPPLSSSASLPHILPHCVHPPHTHANDIKSVCRNVEIVVIVVTCNCANLCHISSYFRLMSSTMNLCLFIVILSLCVTFTRCGMNFALNIFYASDFF